MTSHGLPGGMSWERGDVQRLLADPWTPGSWEGTPWRQRDQIVLVFGSNPGGFHGFGLASIAFGGRGGNAWRGDQRYLQAARRGANLQQRTGLRAIWGQGRGLMLGRTGHSYGVVTVAGAGRALSISEDEIAEQLAELINLAASRPELSFLVPPIAEGQGGYSRAQMEACWRQGARLAGQFPGNFRFVRLN